MQHVTVPRATWDATVKALENSLQSMVQVVQFRETGLGRPPEQTCMDAIAEASAALTAANAVQPQAQGERPSIEVERKNAEREYSYAAHNYPEAPIGSRDWVLYWAGWLARSTAHLQATEPAWRPIETAPKDGTAVFAFWAPRAGIVHAGCFGVAKFSIFGNWANPEDTDDEYTEPTHWMPLPAAPEAKQ